MSIEGQGFPPRYGHSGKRAGILVESAYRPAMTKGKGERWMEKMGLARDFVYGDRDGPALPDRVVAAIADADDTAPPPGIDRPTWGRMTPHDRMVLARFVALLRVMGPGVRTWNSSHSQPIAIGLPLTAARQ